MTINRLLALQAALLVGLSGVFLLPASPKTQPVGIRLQLPSFVGPWYGTASSVTEKERLVLGPGTEFARKVYSNGQGDEIFVSIVLSGQDMNVSIHRPERCLPAQGLTIADSKTTAIPLPDSPLKRLKTTRLFTLRPAQTNTGHSVSIYSLDYYWFVGFTDLSATHFDRTMIDIRDRILKGYNQRWAYITVSSTITKGVTQFGRDEAAVDAMLRTFIQQLFPEVVTTETIQASS